MKMIDAEAGKSTSYNIIKVSFFCINFLLKISKKLSLYCPPPLRYPLPPYPSDPASPIYHPDWPRHELRARKGSFADLIWISSRLAARVWGIKHLAYLSKELLRGSLWAIHSDRGVVKIGPSEIGATIPWAPAGVLSCSWHGGSKRVSHTGDNINTDPVYHVPSMSPPSFWISMTKEQTTLSYRNSL